MKLVVHAYPTEWLPQEVWHAVRNAIINVSHAWGVDVDVEETQSIREAEVRSNTPPELAALESRISALRDAIKNLQFPDDLDRIDLDGFVKRECQRAWHADDKAKRG